MLVTARSEALTMSRSIPTPKIVLPPGSPLRHRPLPAHRTSHRARARDRRAPRYRRCDRAYTRRAWVLNAEEVLSRQSKAGAEIRAARSRGIQLWAEPG